MHNTVSLDNKVCLVTGGTRGIGRAIAEMLLAENARVVVSSQRPESVDRALQELDAKWPGKVRGKAADVRDYAAVRELFAYVDHAFGAPGGEPGAGVSSQRAELGASRQQPEPGVSGQRPEPGLDILVNNAGIGRFGKVAGLTGAGAPGAERSGASAAGLTLDEWHETIGTNLTGAFYCSREALFRFETRGGGFIVNISSLAGKNAFAGGAAYNASKFGLNGFSEALMLDVRYDNVRVSTILPGSVATDFGRSGLSENQHIEGEDWKVHPEDVAAVVRTVLLMPERTNVSAVEIRPSRPKRK